MTAWLDSREGELGIAAKRWFAELKNADAGVCEILHDGHPAACLGQAAFAYLDVFSAHLNVGFFQGASLADPAGLLEGAGRRMRHVKIWPGRPLDEAALRALIRQACEDMRARVGAGR